MFAVATAAHADTIPAGRFCSFPVERTVLTDNTKDISNPGGDRTTGHLVVQFTNTTNGKSVTYNVSGATRYSQTGNILTEIYTGPSYLIMGPGGRGNTGGPAISYLRGRTVLTVNLDTGTVQTLETTAPNTDVCNILS